jgi:thiol-disulfide isomerase/thioredoxin
VTFAGDGRKVALKDKPSLLGPQTSAAIKNYSPATYVEGGKTYRPDPASIAALKKTATPVKVQVFFGSWCPHCQQTLPKLFRVEDQLKGSKIRFEYFGVPKQGMANVPEFKKLSLNGVPSGVVYANGREIGRLVGGEAWVTPEVTLKSIVASGAAGPAKGAAKGAATKGGKGGKATKGR